MVEDGDGLQEEGDPQPEEDSHRVGRYVRVTNLDRKNLNLIFMAFSACYYLLLSLALKCKPKKFPVLLNLL